jgi:hypothetical protein
MVVVAAADLAYEHFLDLTEAFYRQAGSPLAQFESDPGEPIAFEARVGGVKFSVGYDPGAGEACLFVYCLLGALAAQAQEATLLQLLRLNVAESRLHNGTYCLDSEKQEVAYYWRSSITGIDAAALHEQLERIAALVTQWRHDPLGHDAPRSAHAAAAEQPAAPWLPFV